MTLHRLALVGLLLVSAPAVATAQQQAVPIADKEPYLRLETGGPTAFVTSLVFSPDGKKLYSAGWDKVIRVWSVDNQGKFTLETDTFRVPIAPGPGGTIYALALSPDGTWLAAGGYSVFRGASAIRDVGRIWPTAALTDERREDIGMIYVFNTRNRQVTSLRGHRGTVHALAFAPNHPNKPPLLVSVAVERSGTGQAASAAVWDVATGKKLAGQTSLPMPPSGRPGVAAWHTGEQPTQLRVALALQDGRLRVWDLARSETPVEAVPEPGGDPRYQNQPVLWNNRVVQVPTTGKLLTVSRRQALPNGQQAGNQLRWWQVQQGLRAEQNALAFLPAVDPLTTPQDLGLASSTGDAQKPDLAALVLRVRETDPASKQERRFYRLYLIDLQSGAIRAQRDLWDGYELTAVLGVAPGSKHLAVAGNANQEIVVYSVQDLLQQRGEPQRIHTDGEVLHYASFITQGKELGLLLSKEIKQNRAQPWGPPRKGDLFFHLGDRKFSDDPRPWNENAPDTGAWGVQTKKDNNQEILTVFDGEAQAGEIRLPAGMQRSAFALLPPRPPLQVPLLAVAIHRVGEPLLNLYNARTGEQVRQYTGHEERIWSLAFSSDGRFLVSTSLDRTVCIWSLTNLDQILGQRGQIKGLTLRNDETKDRKEARVAAISGGPAEGKLNQDEAIVGIMENGKLRDLPKGATFFSALRFYEAIDRLKPGTDVILRVRNQAGVARNVVLRVGQGIDEQKPLLTLFLTDNPDVNKRDWLAWNPLGPYEASSLRMEDHLGWHLNTGDARTPARFAGAEVYRKQYYREGIVKELIVAGDMSKVPPPPPPAPPRMGMFIQEGRELAEMDDRGQFIARRPDVALELEASGDRLDILKDVSWRVDGGGAQKLAANAKKMRWSQPLKLERGRLHKVRFAIVTDEAQPRTFVKELLVSYEPAPPVLTKGQAPPALVRNAQALLSFKVAPGPGEKEVAVQVVHRHKDKDVLNEKKTYSGDPAQPRSIEQPLKLLPGYNQVEVIAVNAGAPDEFRDRETRRFALEITYVEKAQPPEIALQTVTPLPAAARQEQRVPIEPLKPIVVQVSRIRVEGSVKATELLRRAEYAAGSTGKATPLRTFDPQKKDVPISEEVTLQPGSQSIRFLAKTDSSPEAERVLLVDYRPPTPLPVIQQPFDGEVFRGEKEAHPLELRCKLEQPSERHEYTTRVLLNGQELSEKPVITKDGMELSAPLTLQPGENSIQVIVANRWGGHFGSEKILVRYERPPRIVKLEKVPSPSRSQVELVAQVQSPLRPLPEAVEVRVNNRPRIIAVEIPEKPAADNTWTLRLKGVPLDAAVEENKIVVHAGNAEARCVAPAELTVARAPVRPPLLEILQPRKDCNVSERSLMVRYRVESEQPLEQLKFVLEDRFPKNIDVRGLQRNAAGVFELEGEEKVELSRGPNYLHLEARSEAGEHSSPKLVVNYLPRRTEFVLESLELRPWKAGAGGVPIKLKDLAAESPEFAPVPQAQVRLHGKVRWGDDDLEAVKQDSWQHVHVFVNGFQQRPALLSEAKGLESSFIADVLLNHADNRLVLTVKELSGGERREFAVQCEKPLEDKRLHLVLVSMNDTDDQALKERFAHMLKTERTHSLIGDKVRPEYITALLDYVSGTVSGTAAAGDFNNDVVVIYYQGGELVHEKGNAFQTSLSRLRPKTTINAVPCEDVVGFFKNTPGAHLLLLDVERELDRGEDRIALWKRYFPEARTQVAVMRYAWLSQDDHPQDARLLAALQTALPKEMVLKKLAEQTRQAADKWKNAPPRLDFMDYLPPDLQNLLLVER